MINFPSHNRFTSETAEPLLILLDAMSRSVLRKGEEMHLNVTYENVYQDGPENLAVTVLAYLGWDEEPFFDSWRKSVSFYVGRDVSGQYYLKVELHVPEIDLYFFENRVEIVTGLEELLSGKEIIHTVFDLDMLNSVLKEVSI